ncbi:adenylate kinase [Paenibacillus sp. cl6col]|uniref:ATP-binding protein n=1 Tax=Paenibacillus sp. cl6col TaxID=1761878 RepID=UPI00088DF598|nr:ATP-binding protein [Paenibacillus sp. cl6col]SDF56990.1 adenylate kinase [Paenibacillus sp. cl6col]
MRKIIFVGGIHGVGKTYLCKEICKEIDLPHFSASQLIRKQKEEEMSALKNVTDVKANQAALIMAINNLMIDTPSLLLDGHFCILNREGEIEGVPTETFERMEVACFLVITDEPEKIRARLKARDNIEYSIEMLDNFQSEEISYAKQLSKISKVPLLIHKSRDDRKNLYNFINDNIYI